MKKHVSRIVEREEDEQHIDNEIDRKGGNNKKQGQLPLLLSCGIILWINICMEKKLKEKKCCTESRGATFKRGANLTDVCPEICIILFKWI